MLGDPNEVVNDTGSISGDNQNDQRLEFHIVVFSSVALYLEHDEQNQFKYKGRNPKGYTEESLVSHFMSSFCEPVRCEYN